MLTPTEKGKIKDCGLWQWICFIFLFFCCFRLRNWRSTRQLNFLTQPLLKISFSHWKVVWLQIPTLVNTPSSPKELSFPFLCHYVCVCLGMNAHFAFFLAGPMALFMDQPTPNNAATVFYGSHNTIHTFKNYFATVFSTNKQYPNKPYVP